MMAAMGDDSRFQVVRPLGGARAGVIAREGSGGSARLVIVERVAAAPEERARLLRRGRALAALEHPKVVRVREAIESGEEAVFVSDFVDGEWLSAVMAHTQRPPVEALLRVCVDVLEGLAALHDLRDERGQPMNFVHGGVSPDSVLVAEDGVGEIARTCTPGTAAKDKYVAPELRRGERATDLRSDVYSAGAILRDVLAAAPSTAKWAEQLTDVAFRATSVDPQNRWPSAAAMATAVRRIAGAKLATAHDVATSLRDAYGSRMKARRAALDMLDEAPPPSSDEDPISLRGSEVIVLDSGSEPSLEQERPGVRSLPVPPPVPMRANVARVALVKKAVRHLDLAEEDDPEPPSSRHPEGGSTQKGITALAPPFPPPASADPPQVEPAPKPRVEPAPKKLPPPDIMVQERLPPPDIQPVAESAPATPHGDHDAYRRKLPTFPTEIVVQQRRSFAVPLMGIAAAMVITFGVGWWLGHSHPPPSEGAQVEATSAPVETESPAPTTPPSAATAAGTPATIASAAPSATASATATTLVAPSAPPTVAQAAVAPPVVTAQPVVTAPAQPATVFAAPQPPRPTATATVAAPTPKPSAVPTATASAEPKPTAAPKPTDSSGYTPNEL
jgi:hypothetical protein